MKIATRMSKIAHAIAQEEKRRFGDDGKPYRVYTWGIVDVEGITLGDWIEAGRFATPEEVNARAGELQASGHRILVTKLKEPGE